MSTSLRCQQDQSGESSKESSAQDDRPYQSTASDPRSFSSPFPHWQVGIHTPSLLALLPRLGASGSTFLRFLFQPLEEAIGVLDNDPSGGWLPPQRRDHLILYRRLVCHFDPPGSIGLN